MSEGEGAFSKFANATKNVIGAVGDKIDMSGFDTLPGTAPAGMPPGVSLGVPPGVPSEIGAATNPVNQLDTTFTTKNPAVIPATQPPGLMNAVAAATTPPANTEAGVPPGMLMIAPDQLGAMIAAASAQGKQQGAARRRPKKTHRKQKGKTIKKRKGKTMKKVKA